MDYGQYPQNVQKFLTEMVKRKTITNTTMDKTFMNYLHSQIFDEDYIKSITHDRDKYRNE